ncbi:MAG TPA: hypothetical protein VJA16_12220, partial [Thermoanaerobaculia bacterium]
MLPTLRRGREPLLFAAVLVAPLLPEPFSFGLLLACGLLWLGQRPRPPRREAALAALLAAVAVAALAGDAVIAWEERLSDRRWIQGQAPEYRRVWEGLRAEAAAAAGALKRRPASPLDVLDHPPAAPPPQGAVQAATLAAFDRLGRLTPPAGAGRHALLLIDRDGNAVAWAGEGLVHEPEQWPRSGLSYRAGFNSVTFYAAEPLDDSSRPWRLVAGSSFSTRHLPRALGTAAPAAGAGLAPAAPAAVAAALRGAYHQVADALLPSRRLRWSLVDNPTQAHAGAVEVRLAGAPTLEVEPVPVEPGTAPGRPGRPGWPTGLAWAGVAAALLALGVMRGVGLALPAASTLSGSPERGVRVPALLLGGLFALAMLAGVPARPLVAMEIGVALALLGLAVPRARTVTLRRFAGDGRRAYRLRGPGRVRAMKAAGAVGASGAVDAAGARAWDAGAGWVMAAGAAVMVLLFGAAWAAQLAAGPFDAAEGLMVPGPDWCIRLAWSGAALGLLSLAGRRESSASPAGDVWVWLATGLLLVGAALSEATWAAVPLLAGGGACAARFVDRRRRAQGTVLAALAVIGALAGAAVWETAYRAWLGTYAATALLDRLAPPSPGEMAKLERELGAHFAHLDLDALVARSPVGLDRKDLAYSLWRESPLARPNALSAVALRSGNSLVSSFS